MRHRQSHLYAVAAAFASNRVKRLIPPSIDERAMPSVRWMQSHSQVNAMSLTSIEISNGSGSASLSGPRGKILCLVGTLIPATSL